MFVAEIRAKARARERALEITPQQADGFAAEVGRLVRLGRAKRGMTRRQLAEGAGASERYLAQIEGGQGNPSVVMLKSIAEALELPVIELLPRSNSRAAAVTRIVDLLGGRVTLTSRVGEGSTFRVWLPTAGPTSAG